MSHGTDQRSAWVFDIQRYSVHDGPGVRTTVFLQGCPLRCAWCQNPESQKAGSQLMLFGALCIQCGACEQACPQQLDPTRCTTCGACAALCPTEARRIAGERMTLDAVLEQALRDRSFYGDRGGVTISGGEPLSQWTFSSELAMRLRGKGVHVAIDTSACAPDAIIAQVPQVVDLAIVDLKAVDAETHRRWTGVDNAGILAAIRRWSREMPGRLWVSLPLIPGVHGVAELERMAAFLASLDPTPPARLIPFHRLGEGKYDALALRAPTFEGDVDALVNQARAILSNQGVVFVDC